MSHVVSSKSHPWGQRQSRPLCNPAPGGTPSHRSPLFSGTRSLFPTSCESPPPVVTFQLQFESFGISPTPVFEFGVSKSPIPVFEFDVCLSFKNNSREAITGKSALQAPQQKGWEGQQYKCFMQIRPRPPTRPHIDRCSRPTKPIRFASSPPDCLFT